MPGVTSDNAAAPIRDEISCGGPSSNPDVPSEEAIAKEPLQQQANDQKLRVAGNGHGISPWGRPLRSKSLKAGGHIPSIIADLNEFAWSSAHTQPDILRMVRMAHDPSTVGLNEHTQFRGGVFSRDLFEGLRRVRLDIIDLYETHRDHPVLLYFHPKEIHRSISRMIFLILELLAVIHACLDRSEYANIQDHPIVRQLRTTTLVVLKGFIKMLDLNRRARRLREMMIQDFQEMEQKLTERHNRNEGTDAGNEGDTTILKSTSEKGS
ncbi:hypothetical protein HK102_002596 [Quaeritorhiza haematococci]|nr:hypothetical protein HK102_002596 [Quaeritorhiza haematococci]